MLGGNTDAIISICSEPPMPSLQTAWNYRCHHIKLLEITYAITSNRSESPMPLYQITQNRQCLRIESLGIADAIISNRSKPQMRNYHFYSPEEAWKHRCRMIQKGHEASVIATLSTGHAREGLMLRQAVHPSPLEITDATTPNCSEILMPQYYTARNNRCHNIAPLGINRCIITTLSTGPKTDAMLGPPNCGMLGTADAKNRCLRSAKTG